MTQPIIGRSHYPSIDAIRFSSALLVALFHLGFWVWLPSQNDVPLISASLRPLAPFTWFGWVGVEVFFVISGFVIANSANGSTAREFLWGRVLRLYPAAWICASLTAVALMLSLGRASDADYLRSMTLSPLGPWIDPVYWTLAVEIMFYAAIFLLLCFGWFHRVAHLAWFLTIYSGAFLAYAWRTGAGYLLDGIAKRLPFHPPLWAVANLSLMRHGCLFALGIWLWMRATNQLGSTGRVGLALALLGSAAETALGAREKFEFVRSDPIEVIVPVVLWLVIVATIVWTTRPGRTAARPTTGVSALGVLGLMTYPLYLLHNVIGTEAIRSAVALGASPVLALPAALGILLVLSWIVYSVFEAKIRIGLKRIMSLRAEGERLRPLFALPKDIAS